MKTKIKILGILLGFIISSVIFTKQASAQQANVGFQVFYDELSPYGQWVDHPNYGYIWIPDAGQDFVPYSTNGYWVLTDYGWTWVSNYDWGWAPFHYGRWDYDNHYGWFWLPDNQWGPAWVTWRRANGYYGWSPMQPGISISLSFGNRYNRNDDHWIFVRDRDLERHDINRYFVNRTDNDRIIRNSTVISKTYIDSRRNATYVSGPAREDVQKIVGRKISPVTIQDNNKPGQNMSNGQLRIYRPLVKKGNINGQKPAPNQQRNVNPQVNNQRVQQQKVVTPTNVERKTESTQPQRQTAQPQRQTAQPQRQTVQPQRQTTQPQRQTVQPQRQTTQPQRQTVQPQRQTIQPQRSQKEQQQKVATPPNVKRKAEPARPQKAKSEQEKKRKD